MITLMRNKVLEKTLVVGCTAFVATTLGATNYHASIIIFDESAQATDPDVMMALTAQIDSHNVHELILAGDRK